MPWAVIALVVGACPGGRWRQRPIGTKKAVLRAPGDRPLLGTFLNDPLDVLAGLVGYARGNWASRMLFTCLEVGREPGTV